MSWRCQAATVLCKQSGCEWHHWRLHYSQGVYNKFCIWSRPYFMQLKCTKACVTSCLTLLWWNPQFSGPDQYFKSMSHTQHHVISLPVTPVIPVQGCRPSTWFTGVEEAHICELSNSHVVTARGRRHTVTNHDVPESEQTAALHLSQESVSCQQSGTNNRQLLTFGQSKMRLLV